MVDHGNAHGAKPGATRSLGEAVSIKSAACAVAICLASSAAWAQPAPLPPGHVAGLGPVIPPQEIGRIVRAKGFVPQATPVRNGEAYQVRAIDRYGRQVRLAIDARYGDILMVRPIAMLPPGAYGPRPYGPPPYGPYAYGAPRGYYDDEPPTGTVGGYPPPPGVGAPPARTATVAPVHPPVPRPKPAAKPAAATAAETPPAPAPSTPAAAPAPAPVAPAASAPPEPAAAPSALPPVAPLE
jgi:hypothetical protein